MDRQPGYLDRRATLMTMLGTELDSATRAAPAGCYDVRHKSRCVFVVGCYRIQTPNDAEDRISQTSDRRLILSESYGIIIKCLRCNGSFILNYAFQYNF